MRLGVVGKSSPFRPSGPQPATAASSRRGTGLVPAKAALPRAAAAEPPTRPPFVPGAPLTYRGKRDVADVLEGLVVAVSSAAVAPACARLAEAFENPRPAVGALTPAAATALRAAAAPPPPPPQRAAAAAGAPEAPYPNPLVGVLVGRGGAKTSTASDESLVGFRARIDQLMQWERDTERWEQLGKPEKEALKEAEKEEQAKALAEQAALKNGGTSRKPRKPRRRSGTTR